MPPKKKNVQPEVNVPPPAPVKAKPKVKKIALIDSDSEDEEDIQVQVQAQVQVANQANQVVNQAVNQVNHVNWKNEFEQIITIPKPDDPLDCKVEVGPNARCDPKKIKDGSILYRPARLIVLEKDRDNTHSRVRDQGLHKDGVDGCDWNLGKELIGNQCWTPDQYTKIEKVSTTVLAHKLKEEVGDCVCKVEFTKNPDPADMARILRDGFRVIENAPVSEEEKVKLSKKLFERSQKGEYRIMRGYIVRSEDMKMEQSDTGMVKFLDADLLAKGEMAERMINLRNIVSLTYRLTKYQLK
jgi:hypothetical protein